MPASRLLFALALCPASLAPLALAEDAVLPPVVVEGNREPLTHRTVEAQEERASATPGAATVVTDEAWLGGRVFDQGDLLRHSPGVYAIDGSTAHDGVFMRGSSLSGSLGRGVKSLLDGIPMSRLDMGTERQLQDVVSYKSAEVYRGANAFDLGYTSLFGAVNYQMYTGHDFAKGGETFRARATFGSNDFRQEVLQTGGVWKDFDFFASVNETHTDGYRDHNRQEALRFSGNLGWRLSDQTENRFTLVTAKSDEELPGNLTKANFLADRNEKAANTGGSDLDRNWKMTRISDKISAGDDTQRVEGTVWFNKSFLDHQWGGIGGIIKNEFHELGGAGRYRGETALDGKRRNVLTAGLTGGYTFDTLQTHRSTAGGTAKTNQQVLDAESHNSQLEAFIQNDFEFAEKWHLITALQGAYATRNYRDHSFTALPAIPGQPNVTVGDQSYIEEYTLLNPRLGLLWQAAQELALFGNLSRSAEAPSASEITSLAGQGLPTNLHAQNAWTLEVGARGDWQDRIKWEATAFRSHVKDELLTIANPLAPAQTINQNVDATIHQGIELGADVTLLRGIASEKDRLSVNTVYTYSDFRFDGDARYGDRRLPRLPENLVLSELLYKMPQGFFAGVNLSYVGSKSLTFDHSGGDAYRLGGYTLLGARAGYEQKHWSVFGEVRNLTDKLYAADGASSTTAGAPGSSGQITPGAGMNFYFGAEVKF